SEERRVGEEGKSRGAPHHLKKKIIGMDSLSLVACGDKTATLKVTGRGGSFSFLLVGIYSSFFQAEDGIRDTSVTGVQTCALPISLNGLPSRKPFKAGTIIKASSP